MGVYGVGAEVGVGAGEAGGRAASGKSHLEFSTATLPSFGQTVYSPLQNVKDTASPQSRVGDLSRPDIKGRGLIPLLHARMNARAHTHGQREREREKEL